MTRRTEGWYAGYNEAIRDAVTWLHDRAAQMNDEHARGIYNSAALLVGEHPRPECQHDWTFLNMVDTHECRKCGKRQYTV